MSQKQSTTSTNQTEKEEEEVENTTRTTHNNDNAPSDTTNSNNTIIPTDVIVHHIVPFVNDRKTFNNVSLVSRSVLNGIRNHQDIKPPWPDLVRLQSNSDLGRTFPTSISMSINNTTLVCGGINGQIQIWDTHLNTNKKKPPTPSIAQSPSSTTKTTTTTPTTTIASCSSSLPTMILKTSKKEGRITAVSISPDGTKLVCGGIRYIYLWNKHNNNNNNKNQGFQDLPPKRLGRWMPLIDPGQQQSFNRQAMREHRYRTSLLLDFSSDSTKIISSRRFHIADRHEELYSIKIFDSTDNNEGKKCLATLLGFDHNIEQQILVSSNIDDDGGVVLSSSSRENMIFSAIFSPIDPNQFVCIQAGPGKYRDKHAILICDINKEIEYYNQQQRHHQQRQNNTTTTTTTSSSISNSSAYYYNTHNRTRIETESQISSISFSPNGQYLVSCSFNGSIYVWDITTRECIKVIEATTSSSKLLRPSTRQSISQSRLLVRVAVTFISPIDFVTAQNDTIQQWTIINAASDNKNNTSSNQQTTTSCKESNKENNGNNVDDSATTAASTPYSPTTTGTGTTVIPKQQNQKRKATTTTRFSSWKSLFQQMKGGRGKNQQKQRQQSNNNHYYYYYYGRAHNNNNDDNPSFFCRHNHNVTMTVASRNQQILASRDKSGEIRIVQIQSL